MLIFNAARGFGDNTPLMFENSSVGVRSLGFGSSKKGEKGRSSQATRIEEVSMLGLELELPKWRKWACLA